MSLWGSQESTACEQPPEPPEECSGYNVDCAPAGLVFVDGDGCSCSVPGRSKPNPLFGSVWLLCVFGLVIRARKGRHSDGPPH